MLEGVFPLSLVKYMINCEYAKSVRSLHNYITDVEIQSRVVCIAALTKPNDLMFYIAIHRAVPIRNYFESS